MKTIKAELIAQAFIIVSFLFLRDGNLYFFETLCIEVNDPIYLYKSY